MLSSSCVSNVSDALKHETRKPCEKRSSVDLERLKLPPAHDKVKWKAFDARLADILAAEFPAEIFEYGTE